MRSISFQVTNCTICKGALGKDSCYSGHYVATDCELGYVAILAGWHTECDPDFSHADNLPHDPRYAEGCFGEWEEWMGCTIDQTYSTEMRPPKRWGDVE